MILHIRLSSSPFKGKTKGLTGQTDTYRDYGFWGRDFTINPVIAFSKHCILKSLSKLPWDLVFPPSGTQHKRDDAAGVRLKNCLLAVPQHCVLFAPLPPLFSGGVKHRVVFIAAFLLQGLPLPAAVVHDVAEGRSARGSYR